MLTKVYDGRAVVNGVNMNIQKGDIYGFIGRNGAGKTTLLRMILGLSQPTEGRIELFDNKQGLIESRKKIGSLAEQAAFYPNMTALSNLEICRIAFGGVGDKNLSLSLLRKFGFSNAVATTKKAGLFSLGLRQKLAIAIAFIGFPEFIILDEPINGLDPKATIEVRNLIKDLNKNAGVTFLISSHLLAELSKLANKYGIIEKGRLIDEFSSMELEERIEPTLMIKVDNAIRAAQVIKDIFKTQECKIINEKTVEFVGRNVTSGDINRVLNENGVLVEAISKNQIDIESYFVKVVSGSKK
jgi:ABC-2 type transport system ATP-binding protein